MNGLMFFLMTWQQVELTFALFYTIDQALVDCANNGGLIAELFAMFTSLLQNAMLN
jgi:hypothetical protein